MTARSLLVVTIAGAGLVLLPSLAQASCALPPSMEEGIEASRATFVGTVSAVENYRRWATVDVLEVWNGEVESEVVVKGGPKDPVGGDHVVTTVDRSYRVGKTYLFVVYAGNGSVFRDNICSLTTAFGPQVARFRPASATLSPDPTPTPTGVDLEPEEETDKIVPIGAVAALVVGVTVWIVRRRKS